jgi:hypothetical protein
MQVVELALAFSLTPLDRWRLARRNREEVDKIGWTCQLSARGVQGKTRARGLPLRWRERFTDGPARSRLAVENQNFAFVYRYSEGRPERYPRLAAEARCPQAGHPQHGPGRIGGFVSLKGATATMSARMTDLGRSRGKRWWSPATRGRLAHEVRVSHKSQDRQGARADDSPSRSWCGRTR